MRSRETHGSGLVTRVLLAVGLLLGLVVTTATGSATAGTTAPSFAKVFEPSTIGPGSTSTLRFTITQGSSGPADSLAFTDNLPAAVTISGAPAVSNSCGGTLTAPAGGSTIELSGGMVGESSSCTIEVNVTASTDGVHTNTTGELTSSVGNSGTATDDLEVDDGRPGFFKSFSPSTVPFGGRSTLTFTIDNSGNAGASTILNFTDNLPSGMTVANPSNKATTCGNSSPAQVTAAPGSSTIGFLNAGFVALEALGVCTVSVDVVGGAIGALQNVSQDLQEINGATVAVAGKAAATLEVTAVGAILEIEKEFTDDPVPPGGTVELEFTITNKSRDDAATGITFTDDLDATLGGLAPSAALPTDPCGAGSTLTFALGDLTLAGGSLPAEGFCTFAVTLAVPATAANGSFANSAGPVSGDVGGSPETGNVAGDLLFVTSFPVLTKEFTDDPVGSGGTVTLEFTITNPEDDSVMSDIEFEDVFDVIIPTAVSVPADGFCGPGSTATFTPLNPFSFEPNARLEINAASLGVAGSATDSCTFSLVLDIAEDASGGIYPNETGEISATLDDFAGPPTVTGPGASDDLVVVAPPRLTKEFTDDPVPPGGTATLVFTLENLDPDNAASAIAFQDDLAATLAGLTASSVDFNDCGATVDIVTLPSVIDVSGGTLAADTSCTIVLTLSVPAGPGSAGLHDNETSTITATVAGLSATGPIAEDTLLVTGLLLSKVFVPDVAIPGEDIDLTFTLDNTTGGDAATGILFTDDLADILPGSPDITVVSAPPNPCDGTLTAIGTSLTFSGGSVAAGASCSFTVVVNVPAGADDGEYVNITSSLSATIDGSGVALPPAVDVLTIDSELIAMSKEFTDDPTVPGGTVTLALALTNLSNRTITDIEFEDDLDAVLSGLGATGAVTNTCGGLAAGSPAGLFDYAGGTLNPGAECVIELTVAVPDAPLASGPPYINTTSVVAGKVGTLDVFGAAASDELEIDTVTLSKAFDGPTTATGTAVLSFTITNLDPTGGVSDLSFSDDLSAVVPGLTTIGAVSPNPPCGAGSTLTGTSFVAVSGGNLPGGGSCTFSVTVMVPGNAPAGTYPNTTSELFAAGLRAADPATADLTIEPPPTFAKVFAPDSIIEGSNSTLTFTIDNGASALAASSLAFTDSLPAGVVVATPPNASQTCTGGAITAVAGSGTISYSGGTVADGASCTISVDVTATSAGVKVNTTGNLTSTSGTSGTASDTLTVGAKAPAFSKVFAPDAIARNATSTLTFTIDNTMSGVAATSLDFTDPLPAGVTVATPPAASTTCTGGTITAVAGSGTVSYTGGTVGAGASCTVKVDVTASTTGIKVNTTGDLTSSSGNSGTAADTLTVKSAFATVEGKRYADTRNPGGTTFDGLFAAGGTLTPGSIFTVTIGGRGVVPADAVGAIVNITSVGAAAPGFFTVYDCDPVVPTASALNYTTGVDVANEIFAKLSATGTLCVFTSEASDLLIDVVGYVLPDDSTKLVDAARLADSREGAPTVDGQMAGFGRTEAGEITTIKVATRANVPATIKAAIVNVAAVDPDDDGFVIVYPCGTVPNASSINYVANVNRANELVADVNASGEICILTSTAIDFIVDVVGYVEVGSMLTSVVPARLVDDRAGGTTIDGVNAGGGPLAADATLEFLVSTRDSVPAGATTAIVNVAAVDPTAAGFFTVTGCQVPRPNASSLNFTAGVNGANELVVGLSPTGRLCIYTSATTNVIVDVVGFVVPPS